VVFALLVPAIALEFLGKVDHYSSVGKLTDACEMEKQQKRGINSTGKSLGI
jgi:hypothetical protein